VKKLTDSVTGVRAAILILLGGLFLAAGFSTLALPYSDEIIATDPGIQAHLKLMGPTEIGWFFVLVGALSIILGLIGQHDAGYGIMQFVSTFWALLYLVSWMETGYWRAVFPAAQYALLIGILAVSSRIVVYPRRLLEELPDAGTAIPEEVAKWTER
jgi:hypothetical protein